MTDSVELSNQSLAFEILPHRKEMGFSWVLVEAVNEACRNAFALAKDNGFWTDQVPNIGEKVALMHSELSELLESVRKGTMNEPCDKPIGLTNAEEECADLFIRLADFCGAYKIDLGTAIIVKHGYNLTRPYKHGKKF